MKRKMIPAVIVSVILIIALAAASIAFANDVNWRYDSETKTLYISGNGAMDDYEESYSTPWNSCILQMENLVIEDGITSVGSYAFSGADNLTNVRIADSVTSIGEYSFASCPLLYELELSDSVRNIGDCSFAYDGISLKDFTVKVPSSSYALSYIVSNNVSSKKIINIVTDTVLSGEHEANIVKGGMTAYYPYTAKYDGTFKFYSTGNHDPKGVVYNSNFEQIAYNDDGPSGTNFLINLNVTAGETYYFGASIFNSSLTGTFPIFIEAVEYTVSGTFYAMNDPSGAASSIVIDEAKLDGAETGGTYTRTVTSQNAEAVITAGNKTIDYSFTPDGEPDIVINMCDVNNDGYINGRDLAAMKLSDSKYKPLFRNFI